MSDRTEHNDRILERHDRLVCEASSIDDDNTPCRNIIDFRRLTKAPDQDSDDESESTSGESRGGEVQRATERKKMKINVVSTNARSLLNKLESLKDMFEDLELTTALISETWIHGRKDMGKFADRLKALCGLQIIQKSCTGRNGGGVGIVFNPNKIKLSSFPVKSKFEIVAAVGRVERTSRSLCAIVAYLPPDLRHDDICSAICDITDVIGRLKAKYNNPIVLVGGDFNKVTPEKLTDQNIGLQVLRTGPTRGGNTLDYLFSTSLNHSNTWLTEPLVSDCGMKSDHMTIVSTMYENLCHEFERISFQYRPFTKRGDDRFKEMFIAQDWAAVVQGSPDEAAAKLKAITERMIEEAYPLVRVKYKSTDAPWVDRNIRALSKRKLKVFRTQGRSKKWHELRRQMNDKVKRAKVRYLERYKEVTEKNSSARAYYQALKVVGNGKPDKRWNLLDLFNGKNEQEALEETADFFASITKDFQPISYATRQGQGPVEPLLHYQVAAKIRSFKKSKAVVPCDIPPHLVSALSDFAAVPLTYIYNGVLAGHMWPSAWKEEVVTVIPKSNNPQGLSECRNLSCTPLFSKILESYVLERLKSEVPLGRDQCGWAGR